MIRNIIRGYAVFFSIFLKTFLLLCFCAFSAFIIVFPLWKFAVSFPDQYSLFIICICVIAFVMRFLFRLLNDIKLAGNARQKYVFFHKTVKHILKYLILFLGVIFSLLFFYKEQLVFAFATIILTVILYGILAFGTTKTQTDTENNEQNHIL